MGGRFRVGGLTVQLSGRAGALEALARAWAGFAVDVPAELEVEVEVDPERPRASAPVAMPEVRAGAGGSIQVDGASFRAEIEPGRRSARVRGADERFGVESALKVLLAARLAEAGGLLVHGVALACEGRAGLFTGPSGAGKSTLAGLGRRAGLMVLADELVAVWPGWRVEGTPWNEGRPEGASLVGVGTLAWADPARLAGRRAERATGESVGTLAWADPARLEHPPAASVLRVLAGNVLLPDPGPAGKAAAFHAQAALMNGVHAWTLSFALGGDVGEVLRGALKA